jgi:hypothetical protein
MSALIMDGLRGWVPAIEGLVAPSLRQPVLDDGGRSSSWWIRTHGRGRAPTEHPIRVGLGMKMAPAGRKPSSEP